MNKKELHKIAPTLSKITAKNHGFNVPEGYFDNFEDDVISNLKVQNLPKKEAFNTPDNYFDTLEDLIITKLKSEVIQKNKNTSVPKDYFKHIEEQVLQKTIHKPKKVIKLNSTYKKLIPLVAVAASLLLIFTLNNYKNSNISFDNLATSEIESWIDNGNIDSYDIISNISENELENESYTEDISDKDVLEYLNNEDLNEIIYEN